MNSISDAFGLMELLNSSALVCLNSCYKNLGDIAHVGNVSITVNSAATQSVLAFEPPEPDLVPYECCRSSGVLNFWDDESEDIYTAEMPCASEKIQMSISAQCKNFCESRGLSSVLAEYLTKAKEVFSNIVNLSADIDYFMDDESADEGHIVLRVEVVSDQKTALTEYDRWVDWVISSIPVEQRGFFTLAVRRV